MMISVGDIVAFVKMTAANENSVHPVRESAKHKGQVDSPAAHDADELDMGCVLLSGDSSQVGSAVGSPVTYETQDAWLELKSCAHSLPPHSVICGERKRAAHSSNILRPLLANICAAFHCRVNLIQDRFIGIVL
jgi:hypothetical protein